MRTPLTGTRYSVSDLDDKLREILETHRDATPHPMATKIWVKEIHRAFADDPEWAQIETPSETQRREWEEAHNVLQGDLMTGQEWYKKYVLETKDIVAKHGNEPNFREIFTRLLGAARKASGL